MPEARACRRVNAAGIACSIASASVRGRAMASPSHFQGFYTHTRFCGKTLYSRDRWPRPPPTESQRPRQAQPIRHEHRSTHRPPSHTFAGVRRSPLVLHGSVAFA